MTKTFAAPRCAARAAVLAVVAALVARKGAAAIPFLNRKSSVANLEISDALCLRFARMVSFLVMVIIAATNHVARAANLAALAALVVRLDAVEVQLLNLESSAANLKTPHASCPVSAGLASCTMMFAVTSLVARVGALAAVSVLVVRRGAAVVPSKNLVSYARTN